VSLARADKKGTTEKKGLAMPGKGGKWWSKTYAPHGAPRGRGKKKKKNRCSEKGARSGELRWGERKRAARL